MARAVGPAGRVIAVEPNSENCRLILLNAKANDVDNVELLPVALDTHQGWAYFSTHLGSNGGLIPTDDEAMLDGRGLVVPTFTLDSLVDARVDVLKIDLEGAEGRALAGATRIVESDRPVVITEFSAEMLQRISQVTAGRLPVRIPRSRLRRVPTRPGVVRRHPHRTAGPVPGRVGEPPPDRGPVDAPPLTADHAGRSAVVCRHDLVGDVEVGVDVLDVVVVVERLDESQHPLGLGLGGDLDGRGRVHGQLG